MFITGWRCLKLTDDVSGLFCYMSIQEALRERKPPSRLVWRAWNSLLNREKCSLLLLVSISWKFHEFTSKRYSVMLPTNTDPDNKKGPYAQGVTLIIPKIFQIVPCVIANISWKFHENPLIDFTVMLQTNTLGAPRWETVKQSRQVWNNLANYFLCRAWHFIKIS